MDTLALQSLEERSTNSLKSFHNLVKSRKKIYTIHCTKFSIYHVNMDYGLSLEICFLLFDSISSLQFTHFH